MSAIRLTFSVENGVPELVKQQRVTMRVPKVRHLNLIDREQGTWIETRDNDGERLFARTVIDQALSSTIEVRTGVANPGLMLREASQARALHIVLPANKEAKSFHFMRRDKQGEQAKEMLSGEF